MPDSLIQLRAKMAEQIIATETLQPQLEAAQTEADTANATRNNFQEQLIFHQSVLTGLTNQLYPFFRDTMMAHPEASTYEEIGRYMDEAAAATPPPPPPPEEPPPEEPPPEEPPPEELPPEEP